MRGVNIVIIAGNVGRDPEVKYLQSGGAIAKFSVAVSETWKGQDGEQKERTEWVPVVCFGHLAEICEKYLAKGNLAVVVGKFRTREYEHEGEKRKIVEIIADKVQFSGKKKGEEDSLEGPSDRGDDVPF
jgi:single-strand DNA-binding protein